MSPLPLFPLRTVLFPGGLLPLRIFEPRYVDMVRQCLRADEPFGVVLIRAGGETGPIGGVAGVGTGARIVDFQALPDGLLGLMCRGERRFRLQRRTIRADGLHVGEVEWLPEPESSPLEPAQQPLVRVLQRLLAELGETARFLEPRYDDAGWVGCRCAELLPLDDAARQRLLEIDDPAERLRQIMPLLDIGAD
jgi:Lon protease-like protein